jgi:hypothetical protein
VETETEQLKTAIRARKRLDRARHLAKRHIGGAMRDLQEARTQLSNAREAQKDLNEPTDETQIMAVCEAIDRLSPARYHTEEG